MRKALIGSAALHLAVLGATMIAWPHSLDLPDEPPESVPVELVTIADETNIKPTVTEPAPEQPPPEEKPPAPTPEPEAEAEPPPPEAAPEPEPKPVEKVEAPKPEPPKIVPRKKPQPDKPKSKFDVNNILALLDQQKPKTQTAPAANATQSDTNQKGIGAQSAFTMSEIDALLAQMRECWNFPAGAPNPEKLIVQVRVFLTPDGHLQQPPRLLPGSQAATAGDPYMRSAADAALRAINVCEPYKLPPEKYDSWREIVMTFDPKKLAGR